ncbi:hypothetical protein P9112_008404 [Eukaryota sp. TZLM1-RC]
MPSYSRAQQPVTHTTMPVTTGSAVLAVKYNGGVLVACDTLASYGSLARFPSVERLRSVGDNTLIAASGDFSDFQMLMEFLDEEVREERSLDDGYVRSPSEYHQLIARILYNKRNRMDPWWLQCIVAGFHNEPFLGLADLRGTHYVDDFLATGFGSYLATPLFRKYWTPGMTLEEAKNLLIEAIKVLIGRDGRTHAKWQMGNVTQRETRVEDPAEIEISWAIAQ